MRLIDIDKISKDAEWDEQFDGFTSYSSAMIDEAEIVEAIPIEWLQKKYDKWKDRDVLGWSYCVKLLIEEWEKENETN